MSVYRPKKSPFYHYDFQLRGHRFSGSTGRTSRAEAKVEERRRRDEATQSLEAEARKQNAPLTFKAAASRWWLEVGQHHRNSDTTLADLNRLTRFFGPDTLLVAITDDEVARLMAWRRAQTVRGRTIQAGEAAPVISAATVNRSVLQPLQKILYRAIEVWRLPLPNAPRWRRHRLEEPTERVREVRRSEEGSLKALPPDYRPVADFARASGLRMASCLLRKDEVDLAGGLVRTIGKGGKPIAKPITVEMRAILMAAIANPTEHVFTYGAKRVRTARDGAPRKRGQRMPITLSGLKTVWRRARTDTYGTGKLPADLRFHDLRHDFATKLLRETGNLKLVQRALDHSKIETTTRYAHVLDEEVLAGMEAASRARLKARTG